MSYGNISVGTSATSILSANPQRSSFKLKHNGTNAIFLGDNSSVTTSNGYPFSKATLEYKEETVQGRECYKGAIYGIVASSTEDLRYIERE